MKNIFNLYPQRSRSLAMALAIILSVSMVGMGVSCNPAWLTTTVGILQTVAPIALQIVGLVAAFNPGTIPPSLSTKLNAWLNDASQGATTLQTLVTDYNKISASDPAKPGKLKDINDLIATLNQDLTQVLAAAHIDNTSLQGKITNAVGLLLAAIQDVTKLIPGVVTPTLTPAAQEAVRTARQAGHGRNAAAKPLVIKKASDLKSAFNTLMLAPTADPKINQVASGLVLK